MEFVRRNYQLHKVIKFVQDSEINPSTYRSSLPMSTSVPPLDSTRIVPVKKKIQTDH